MSFDTTTYRLSDAINIIGGGTPKRSNPDFWGGTIPWLSVVDFNSDARFVEDTVEKITQEGLEKSSTKLLDKGQLIISARGTVGCLAQLTKPMAFNQSCYGLDGKTGVVENNYLYYLIKLKVTELKQKTHGAVFDTITRETFNHIDVDIPDDPDVRRKIAKTLGDLDKKIATNTQTKQTLEQIAQAIFKSWFVDFEPVKAKVAVLEAGGTAEQAELAAMSAISAKDEATLKQLQAEQPDAYTELAQTAALFPSAMDESELGEIPEGWEASGLESCTIELRRGISPKYTEEGGIRVINQKCIRNHTVDFTLARRNDPSKRKIEGREIEVGDVLVNSTGVGTLGRLAPVRYLDETTVVDSHVTVVRADTGKISKSFLSGLMIVNESFIEASGAGSTGQTELRKQVLEDIRFAQPSPEIDSKYDFIVSHMSPQIAELEKQRSTLASTRDSLLPKLLAGDLQVTNTDEELA